MGRQLSASAVSVTNGSRRFVATSRFIAPGVEFAQGHCQDYAFPPHVHEGLTIGLVTAGEESLQFGAEFHPVRAGAVYAFPPDHIHGGVSLERSGWRYLSLYLTPQALASLLGKQELSRLYNGPRLLQESVPSKKIASALLALNAADARLATDGAVSDILSYLDTSHGADDHTRVGCRGKESRRLACLRAYIDAHYTEDLSLARLALVVGWSRQHIISVFKSNLGVTPYAYLIARRLEAARAKLMVGMSVSAAAMESGFCDQSHLTRHFGRAYGQPPAAYIRSTLPS